MAAAWSDALLLGLTFNHPNPQVAASALINASSKQQNSILTSSTPVDDPGEPQQRLIERLQAFAQGAPDSFLDVQLDLSTLTEFQRRVVHYCRRIPAGKVLTYGQLARKAGSPNAARAVGQVMAGNRWPLIVPCHRVVAAGGSLGGFSAPQGLEIKRHLLAREGVALNLHGLPEWSSEEKGRLSRI